MSVRAIVAKMIDVKRHCQSHGLSCKECPYDMVKEEEWVKIYQRMQTAEADKLWQKEHDSDALPDLGVLIDFLMNEIDALKYEALQLEQANQLILRASAELERLTLHGKAAVNIRLINDLSDYKDKI